MKAFSTIFFLCLLAWPSTSSAWEGIVLHVYDGDTLTVGPAGAVDVPVCIRLYGIDAPEMNQDGGKASRDALQKMLPKGSAVHVIPLDVDRYGRVVGLIIRDGMTANARMVEMGHAWVYKQYCRARFCRRWLKTAKTARAEGRGLWADENPIQPRVWRKAQKKSSFTE